MQWLYEWIDESRKKLTQYRQSVDICEEKRNSYSKSDHDATFMRVKKNYMGNDQLLPAYNIRWESVTDILWCMMFFQYVADSDCFQPFMQRFHEKYAFYPRYPVADAGYGNLNNYLYCAEHSMKKCIKFDIY